MEKVVLSVEIPAIDQKYDVLVNPDISVGEIIKLLCKAVEDASNHSYVSSGSEILCLMEEQRIMRDEELLSKYNLRRGDHLLML